MYCRSMNSNPMQADGACEFWQHGIDACKCRLCLSHFTCSSPNIISR